jgi:hypothetical protein
MNSLNNLFWYVYDYVSLSSIVRPSHYMVFRQKCQCAQSSVFFKSLHNIRKKRMSSKREISCVHHQSMELSASQSQQERRPVFREDLTDHHHHHHEVLFGKNCVFANLLVRLMSKIQPSCREDLVVKHTIMLNVTTCTLLNLIKKHAKTDQYRSI